METAVYKWIIAKQFEAHYYSGQSVPSTQMDMFTGVTEEFVPIIWTEVPKEATRFNTPAEAARIANLIHQYVISGLKIQKVQVKQRMNG